MYGYRARIGYTSPPAATEVFPYEFYKIVPDGVTLVVNTLPLVDRNSDEVDRAYEVSLNAAHAMARAGVDLFCFGGVPINVSQGFGNADNMAAATQKEIGIPCITSFSAQREAHEALESNNVGIIYPYDDSHYDRHANYISKMGKNPVGYGCLYTTFIKLGQVDDSQVFDAAKKIVTEHPETDTIHIFCPHFATAEVIEPIEQELGVTVVTALGAIVWNALRKTRVNDSIPGYGRLFRDF